MKEVIPPGAMWSMVITRHRLIRLTAAGPGANVSALLYNADQPLDRLNLPDTFKAQHTSMLTRGNVLMSDMGHAMASIVDDSVGWHDGLGGHLTARQVRERFGNSRYQDQRNDFLRSARDNFLIELGKHGLGLRDVVANINFFSKVVADEMGRISFYPNHAPEGSSICLRTDMNVLLVLANCPHPMDPRPDYSSQPIEIEISPGVAPGADDECRLHRPENDRALQLSDRRFI